MKWRIETQAWRVISMAVMTTSGRCLGEADEAIGHRELQ
jgi:hypothetical protein